MLTRINGVAFHNQEELDAFQQQEARERDHRKIGREMGLFMTDDLVGRMAAHVSCPQATRSGRSWRTISRRRSAPAATCTL